MTLTATRPRSGRTPRSRSLLVTSSLGIAVAAVLLPFYWLIIAATHSSKEIFDSPPPLLPGGHLMDNLSTLESSAQFSQVIVNSLLITVIYTLAAGAICTLAGYGFAKFRFRGSGALFGLLMLGLVIPTQVTLIPLFKMMVDLEWLGTYQAVIMPNLALPFGIFLMRQSMAALPDELIDSARMDGCGEFRLFLKVVLPPMKRRSRPSPSSCSSSSGTTSSGRWSSCATPVSSRSPSPLRPSRAWTRPTTARCSPARPSPQSRWPWSSSHSSATS